MHNARINVCCDVSAYCKLMLILTYVQLVTQGFIHRKATLICNYSHIHHDSKRKLLNRIRWSYTIVQNWIVNNISQRVTTKSGRSLYNIIVVIHSVIFVRLIRYVSCSTNDRSVTVMIRMPCMKWRFQQSFS
jgi:hypothetical protein